jgi:NAD(P)-dependent dehydrogenase (short-subunit alcohol dehydrogenase family)
MVQGSVVNVSSTGAVVPSSAMQSYGVAKAAQDKLTKNLAFELAPKGVRVNSVLPGARASAAAVSERWDGALCRICAHCCFSGRPCAGCEQACF